MVPHHALDVAEGEAVIELADDAQAVHPVVGRFIDDHEAFLVGEAVGFRVTGIVREADEVGPGVEHEIEIPLE